MLNVQKIKDIAKEKKISLKVLAEKAGLSYDALMKIFSNGSTRTTTLEKIAEILNVNVSEFYNINNLSNEVSYALEPGADYTKHPIVQNFLIEIQHLKEQIERSEKKIWSLQEDLIACKKQYEIDCGDTYKPKRGQQNSA